MSIATGSLFARARAARLQRLRPAQPLVVFVVGRTGAGKSGTVNTLLCAPAAFESEHDVGTFHVKPHTGFWRGMPVRIYDTPGFGDALEADGNDERYLAEIAAIGHVPDVILFVTSLSGQRSGNIIDEAALQLIIRRFQAKVLIDSMVFVFTFADRSPERFQAWSTDQYKRFCRIANVDPVEAARIPAFSLDNSGAPHERTRESDKLWLQLLPRCRRITSTPLLRLGAIDFPAL